MEPLVFPDLSCLLMEPLVFPDLSLCLLNGGFDTCIPDLRVFL
jgi:hypothetical protein